MFDGHKTLQDLELVRLQREDSLIAQDSLATDATRPAVFALLAAFSIMPWSFVLTRRAGLRVVRHEYGESVTGQDDVS